MDSLEISRALPAPRCLCGRDTLSSRQTLCALCVCGQSCPTLCDPMDCSLPGSSVYGIFKQEYWVASPSSRGSFPPWNQTHVLHVSCIGRQILYPWATWEGPSVPWNLAKAAQCYEDNLWGEGMCRNAAEDGSQGQSYFRGQIVWVCPGSQSWASLEI